MLNMLSALGIKPPESQLHCRLCKDVGVAGPGLPDIRLECERAEDLRTGRAAPHATWESERERLMAEWDAFPREDGRGSGDDGLSRLRPDVRPEHGHERPTTDSWCISRR